MTRSRLISRRWPLRWPALWLAFVLAAACALAQGGATVAGAAAPTAPRADRGLAGHSAPAEGVRLGQFALRHLLQAPRGGKPIPSPVEPPLLAARAGDEAVLAVAGAKRRPALAWSYVPRRGEFAAHRPRAPPTTHA